MKNIVNWHYKKYPLMNEQDLYRLLFQSEFVDSHLITDTNVSLQYLYNEVKQLHEYYQDLYEYISPNYIRVYLRPYIKYNLSLEYLNEAYIDTLNNNHGFKQAFVEKLELFNISNDLFSNHSQQFIDNYFPNYRIIDIKYLTDEMKYIQIYNYLNNIHKPSIISLEGKCGSGKTTLTNKLKDNLDISIINVDDFFLPQERKTKNRLNEIGGNIDYERIYQLLDQLTISKNIAYFRYNCSNSTYEKVELKSKNIIILEGVYSYHPYFRKYIDKLIYLDINDENQLKRLKTRVNFDRFITEWIPLENKYFDNENVKYLANLII